MHRQQTEPNQHPLTHIRYYGSPLPIHASLSKCALVAASGHAPDQRPLERDSRRQQPRAVHGVPSRKRRQQPEHARVDRRAHKECAPIGHAAQQVLQVAHKVSQTPGARSVALQRYNSQRHDSHCYRPPTATCMDAAPANGRCLTVNHAAQQVLRRQASLPNQNGSDYYYSNRAEDAKKPSSVLDWRPYTKYGASAWHR